MANDNPYGSAIYWYDGSVSSAIDNGVNSTFRNWIGTSDYCFQGTAQGYLQGGGGSVGDTEQNLIIISVGVNYVPPIVTTGTRAYAIIIF